MFISSYEEYMRYTRPEFDDIRVPLRDIERATKRFAEENLLKRGEKADVYKGVLLLQSKLGIDVVIKRYKGFGSDFYDGIKLLRGLKHRNVVSFVGICDEDKHKPMIVMEHVVNGSLEKYVTDPTNLPWSQRLHICFGAALALKYWKGIDHVGYHTKGFKVLLDKYWEAKVVFDPRTRPWYETENASLGWILLEVMYGRKATIEDVNQYLAHNELDDMIDPNLRKQMHYQSLSIFSELAYMCLKERRYGSGDGRIAISDIVGRLKEAFEVQWKHENYLWMESFAYLKIPLRQVKLATNNFAATYSVDHTYKDLYRAELELNRFDREIALTIEGELPRKTVIIKRINTQIITRKHFYAELEMHSRCNHPNLLSFHGFCDEDSEMLFVFDGHFKESLNSSLTVVNMNSPTWEQRIHICLDIAHGLKYLHNMEAEPCTIHQLIWSNNVMQVIRDREKL